jgi:G:T-mismatch repair DNA endonuclease (very short patch repair protein)
VPRPPHQPAELLTAEPFLGWWAVDEGLLTPDQLRSSAWRRIFRGVYVHRDVPLTHEVRAEAACVLLPFAVVSGRSAAVLWGVDLAGADDDVEVTVPPGSHPTRVPGLRVRRAVFPAGHRSCRGGVPLTSPEATAVRLAGLLRGDEAVIAVDQMVETGYTDLGRVRALAAGARGRGAARARRACALADGLAQSPQETRVRLLLHQSELPHPVAQFRVMDGDRFVARVDFAWPERKIALEYDGLWHAGSAQFAKDRRRLNRLTAAGWRVIFVTAADMHDPAALLARIAAALSR